MEHAFLADNLLGLVYKIVKGNYDAIPDEYSDDLRNLVDKILNKDESQRPTVQEILLSPFLKSKMEDFINPNTQAETTVIGDPGLRTLKENDIIQLERRGYYRVDKPYINAANPLRLFMIPDGKKKAMSGLDGKLAHR